MHTRKSVEGLNIELAGLEFDDKVDQVRSSLNCKITFNLYNILYSSILLVSLYETQSQNSNEYENWKK